MDRSSGGLEVPLIPIEGGVYRTEVDSGEGKSGPRANRIAWDLRAVLLVSALYQASTFLNADLGIAFYRTLVNCPANPPNDIPASRNSGDWSGSKHCFNKDQRQVRCVGANGLKSCSIIVW